MRAISALNRDAGTSTRWCRACTAFRILVSMSAIGSVISRLFLEFPYSPCAPTRGQRPVCLPAALDDAGHLTAERELAEAQTAECKLPQERPRAAALPAAVPVPDGVLRLLEGLDNLRCRRPARPFRFSF